MDYFINFAKTSNKYLQLFESDPDIKYIEIDTYRKCYWYATYNPDKFELNRWKIRCKQSVIAVEANDLPLLHYYDRNMNEHVVTDISEMFMGCTHLQSIDVSNWNVSKVTNMSSMFSNCSQLQSLDVNKWNTGNVTNMNYMFSNCIALQSLDMSNWNTSNVTNMKDMFYCCPAPKPSWYEE